jgi:kynureninase
MLATFYRPTPARHKILIEGRAFPSDHYAVESQIRWHGLDVRNSLAIAEARDGEALLDEDDVCDRIAHQASEIAVILLPGVQYFTGQAFDIARITREAHRQGIIVGFDMAHAAGNIELRLHEWDVDFAVWCCYKYLNSGPGAVGGCFIHERHARNTALPRLAGWWGHDKSTRFQMPSEFVPISTAEGWQISNPPIFSMAAIRAALAVFDEAGGMAALRTKSERLTEYMIQLLDAHLPDQIEIITPRAAERRGCQLSLQTKSGRGSRWLCDELAHRGVTTDYRNPNVLRAAPVPLYNSFCDVWQFVDHLREILGAKA